MAHHVEQVMVGGTNPKTDLSQFWARVPDILVATPGRLNDHLSVRGTFHTALLLV